jgi:hypothetical protein
MLLATDTEAVIVEAFRPKETPLALEKVTADKLLEVVPAEMLMLALGATETVMVEPFNPKLTLFKLEKTTRERLLEVVPAETLIAESEPH